MMRTPLGRRRCARAPSARSSRCAAGSRAAATTAASCSSTSATSAGIVQVVIDPESVVGVDAHSVRGEYVAAGRGRGRATAGRHREPRAADRRRSRSRRRTVEVLNPSEPLPIPIDDRIEADEMLRLRHRYLDLRSRRLQRNLRLRARGEPRDPRRRSTRAASSRSRRRCSIASTPEGARDFVVPSRLAPGSFYALPQSPQLFKQLLMVGGVDRYYQIARCLRDEDPRADRQFEFTQLDAEMSFADGDDVMEVIAEVVCAAIEAATGERPRRSSG